MAQNISKLYIDGRWVDPAEAKTLDVDNPATEKVCGKIALGSAADVDLAVAAARRAFDSWSQSSRAERLELLQAILAEYQRRSGDLADGIVDDAGQRVSFYFEDRPLVPVDYFRQVDLYA